MAEKAFLRALHDAEKDIAHLDDEGQIARTAVEHAGRVIGTNSSILLLARTDTASSFVVRAKWPSLPEIRFPPLDDLHLDVHCIVKAKRPLHTADMHGLLGTSTCRSSRNEASPSTPGPVTR